jgi:foldase protein PrsA
VDHIVAAVNNEVITASELAQAVALNEQFGSPGVQDREAVRSETLNGLITRQLLVQEARRLRFVEVSDQEISVEVDKIKKRFPSDAAFADFLKSQDMTQQELGRMLGERLLVERFVEKKVGLFVRVNRDEAQSYFDDHPAQFQGKRFQEVQEAITAFLLDQKIGQQLDQYVAELRAKADIRVNPS